MDALGTWTDEPIFFCNRRHQPWIYNGINRSMDKIAKLERIVNEQEKQIESLRRAIVALQQQLVAVSKKTNRAYESSRRNTNDINTVNRIIRRVQ